MAYLRLLFHLAFPEIRDDVFNHYSDIVSLIVRNLAQNVQTTRNEAFR